MKYLLIILFSLNFASDAMAQQDSCACCSADHQAFDFWVGQWEVYDTSGTKIGENLILKLEDDCILQEHWKGTSGLTGSSFNYFNKQDSTWNQLWIDNSGNHLLLKGQGADQRMVMKSELVPGQKIDLYKIKLSGS